MQDALDPSNELLREAAAEGVFSVREWEVAVAAVGGWLKSRGLTATTADIIAYVSCCAAGQSTSPALSDLTEITLDYLDDFGFEKAVPVPNES